MESDLQWRSIAWPDGSLYEGLTRGGKPESYGVMLHPNRDRYEGQFSAGSMDGYGVYVWSNGTIYRGEWVDGSMHGCGVRIWRGKTPGREIAAAEGRYDADGWVGPVMPCSVPESTDAAVESDMAARQARAFMTARGHRLRASWRPGTVPAGADAEPGRASGSPAPAPASGAQTLPLRGGDIPDQREGGGGGAGMGPDERRRVGELVQRLMQGEAAKARAAHAQQARQV